MKIAFATIYDARDVRRGSGWPYYLTREIERQGHKVHYIGPIEIALPLATRLFGRTSKQILGKRYRSYQDPFIGRTLGQVTARTLRHLKFDFLLTNDYSIAAYTPCSSPKVLYTDSMFPNDYSDNIHPWLDNLSYFSVRFCQHVTQRGLEKAAACIFPAESAAAEAVNGYGVPAKKVSVIPFGANLEDPGGAIAAARSFGKILNRDRIDLLFVGKDWQLKGGDTALEVVRLLRQQRIDAVLHIVGAEPPKQAETSYVKCHGYLDKSSSEERRHLHQLFSDSDVFLMPSQIEGYGIAYVEAAAYGLPSLAYDTMGVASAVRDGKSGVLLPLGAPPYTFVDIIASWYGNPTLYDSLVLGARQHYEATANWKTAVQKLVTSARECL